MSDRMPATESRNPQSHDLDLRSNDELVRLIVADQRQALDAVERAADPIARVIDAVVQCLEAGGRLHYVGAGTSGRLAVLDASEIPPTFGAPPELVCAHIAGGDAALTRAVEGAEDDVLAAVASMNGCVRPGDAVIGISASGSAAFVVHALERAKFAAAYTAAIVNTQSTAVAAVARDVILLETGPEVLTGSTRLKAGTAQKIALNAISTAVMVRLGKVYDNLMVDVVATNKKLRARARRLVQTLTGLDATAAQRLLDEASGRVKVAVVMAQRGVDARIAAELLESERGFLRAFL